VRIKCRLENLNERDHLKDIDIDESVILQWILNEQSGRVCAGFF
jgi:hypothetical protein